MGGAPEPQVEGGVREPARSTSAVGSLRGTRIAIWGGDEGGRERRLDGGVAAYLVAARSARHVLELGQGVIVEAANAEPEGRAVWRELGEHTGVSPSWVQVTCSNPTLHRARLEARGPGYPGVMEPSWQAVSARSAGFADWDDERTVVNTVEPLDVVVASVVAALTTT